MSVGKHYVFTRDMLVVGAYNQIPALVPIENPSYPLVKVINELGERGLFVVQSVGEPGDYDGITLHVSEVRVTGVVHTINPKYLPKGGVGYTEPNVYTYGGDMDAERDLVKISDDTPNLEDIVSATLTYKYDGRKDVFIPGIDLCRVEAVLDTKVLYAGSVPLVMVSNDPLDAGLFVYNCGIVPPDDYDTIPGYVSEVRFTDTVRTIDRKYLPKKVTIDLDKYGFSFLNYVMSGGGRDVVDGTDAMWEEIENADCDVNFSVNFAGAIAYMEPTVVVRRDGILQSISMALNAALDTSTMTLAYVTLYKGSEGTSVMDIAVSSIPINN